MGGESKTFPAGLILGMLWFAVCALNPWQAYRVPRPLNSRSTYKLSATYHHQSIQYPSLIISVFISQWSKLTSTLAESCILSVYPLTPGGTSNYRVYYWPGPGGADDQGCQRLPTAAQTRRYPNKRLGHWESCLRWGVWGGGWVYLQ